MDTMLRLVWIACLLNLGTTGLAEPWLTNRFAQNCSGCHAPGRKNLKPVDRRCTLSCQGCHVNPNGGGLRNHYGRWNQERWLRSFRTKWGKTERSPAPPAKQPYVKNPFRKKAKKQKWVYKEGFNFTETNAMGVDEKPYGRDPKFEGRTVGSNYEKLYQIPTHDPYRQLDYGKVDGGGDILWLARNVQEETNSNETVADTAKDVDFFMMNFDAGIRYRPIHRHLSLVYEGRYFGNPSEGVSPRKTFATGGTRSLYLLLDDLPFNTFVQAGWYKPLIGSNSPDHNALGQKMLSQTLAETSRGQTLQYETITVGTAPNVPFLNLHVIQGRTAIGSEVENDRTRGYAANIGLRFVTLGAAVNYTYWKTKNDHPSTGRIDTEVYAFGLSAQLWRVTTGVEVMSFSRDKIEQDFRRGGVVTVETMTRLWRENYFLAQYASGNRAVDLLPGSSNQMKVGLRNFWIAGLETQVTYDRDFEETREESGTVANEQSLSYVTSQVHVYF